MDREIDLATADRDLLIAIIVRQQAIIERLEQRIAQLEGEAKARGSGRMPGLKPKADRKPAQPKSPRKPRPHGFARARMTPTQRVEHTVDQCPDCGTRLSGGWAQRTREVIDLPQVPVQVTEHVYIARICPRCRRHWTPRAATDDVALGKQRLGVNIISLIAALREEARLPVRTIRWYLDAVHGLRLSLGAIVAATHQVARKAQAVVAGILEHIRGSPVVHADETGWREDGHNGYVWTFSTPTQRYFLRRGRGKTVVDEVLGDEFCGCWSAISTPPTTTTTVPSNAAGPTCCGTSTTCAPATPMTRHWPGGPTPSTGFTTGPKPALIPRPSRRRTAQLALERQLLAICQPFLDDPSATQARLCRRIERHLKELFVFVAEPAAPSDNNAAERSLRHSSHQPQGQRRHPLTPGH